MQPYYVKKQQNSLIKSGASANTKALVTSLTYFERKRQLIVCSSDGYISFWDYDAGYMIGFVSCDIPQVLCHNLQHFPYELIVHST